MGNLFRAIALGLAEAAASIKEHRAGLRRARSGRRWIFGFASIVLIAAVVGTVWPHKQRLTKVATPQSAWASIDSSGYLLRLSGSKTIGSVVVPELVKAWLVSVGASDVEAAQRVGPDDNKIPESLIRARLKGNSVVVEVKAHGSSTAFRDMAKGEFASREINSAGVTQLMPLAICTLRLRNMFSALKESL